MDAGRRNDAQEADTTGLIALLAPRPIRPARPVPCISAPISADPEEHSYGGPGDITGKVIAVPVVGAGAGSSTLVSGRAYQPAGDILDSVCDVTARVWHAVIAVLVLVAVIVQIIIAIQVSGTPHDTSVGLLRGSSTAGRIIRVLSFFTIESNLLSGMVSAQLAIRPDRDGTAWRCLRLAALFGITVTGIVYSTVLAKIHEPNGPAETLVNDLVHYVVPIMMIFGWLFFGPRPRITRRTIVGSMLFPVLWVTYTVIRGAIWKWYPYPFLDVPTLGYLRVTGNAALVTVVLAIVAGLFAFGDRTLPAVPKSPARVD